MVRAASQHKHDILALCCDYLRRDVVVSIPRNRAQAFIECASALAEAKLHTQVKLTTKGGTLGLSFTEQTGHASERFPLADVPYNLPEVMLDAKKMARVLKHADKIALDNLDHGILVFFGPGFSHFMNGPQERTSTPDERRQQLKRAVSRER
jgi:hypothetical protein